MNCARVCGWPAFGTWYCPSTIPEPGVTLEVSLSSGVDLIDAGTLGLSSKLEEPDWAVSVMVFFYVFLLLS